MSVCVSLCRDSQVEAEQRQNIHMEAQHAFTARRQISDQEDSNDRQQESTEVIFKSKFNQCIEKFTFKVKCHFKFKCNYSYSPEFDVELEMRFCYLFVVSGTIMKQLYVVCCPTIRLN